MSGDVPDFVQSAANLRRSLEEAAGALANADLSRLLACETRIHAALTHVSTSNLSAAARAELANEVTLARTALQRCRRFGQALDDFIRIRLSAQGLDGGYGPDGPGMSAALHTIHRTA